MKFFVFSIVLHIFIFIVGFSLDLRKNFQIENVGNNFSTPSISVNFNSSQISHQSEPTEPLEDTIEEKEDIVEEKIEEKIEPKIEEPKIEEKKLEVIKEEKKEEKKKEKKKEKKVTKPKKTPEEKKIEPDEAIKQSQNDNNIPSNNNDLIELSHGVFAAKNQGVQGLMYSFISQPDPEYPLAAKRISYSKEVSIKVRFLVGLNGEIEEVKFYNETDSLGFQKEVEKTLKKWKSTPVTLNNKPIKLYFYKEFKFNQK